MFTRRRVSQLQDELVRRQHHGEHRLRLVGDRSLGILGRQHLAVRDSARAEIGGKGIGLHGVHLISVDVDLKSGLLASLQDATSAIIPNHAFSQNTSMNSGIMAPSSLACCAPGSACSRCHRGQWQQSFPPEPSDRPGISTATHLKSGDTGV
ncbi:hypothetical protein PR003_g17241 [Phytophthora rubi]|uniref:Uncharacterized protein n=1 Tax=Phytophthora rubi TaxID=129364 RepID=A0A6A4EH29_9STRA|nr:hypothetical protein PR003_g17241 [Phytophthora rubi]